MPARDRPTSPHLQIYRWQIGNSLSILHRLTGIALAFGLLALCFWLMALAGGEGPYALVARAFASPLGRIGLSGWTFAFLFHLLNGVRHLFWDAGMGFERTQRHTSGWFAALGALGLTLCIWVFIWRSGS
ncbi:MAG: succinate dehydrogenase, cytochrome b556 subunit [Gammaproteobacteria bacterium]